MENRKFIKPLAELVEFYDTDIIVTSGEGDVGEINYPWWGGGFGGPDTPSNS